MPLRPPREPPKTSADWDRWARATEIDPDDLSVTDDKLAANAVSNRALRDSVATSVIGRSGASTGDPADIAASADGQLLVRRSGALGFGTLVDADIPSTIARDTEVSAAVVAHVALSDPHTQYRLESANVPYTEVSGKPAALGLLYSGTGSPESVVTAGVGSLYLRTDGGASTTLYVKESGTGNTGWIAK